MQLLTYVMAMFRAPSLRVLPAALSCLFFVACGPKEVAADPRPNWYRDAQPLVAQHCQTCHSPGGVTPFTLTSYDDFKAHSAEIRAAVQARIMPPWMPSSDCNTYQGDRSLTQAQIDTLTGFIDNGLLLGDKKDEQHLDVTIPGLDRVDLTLQPEVAYMPNSFATNQNRSDDYRCFIVKPNLTGPKDLIGYRVVPGELHEVHHVLVYTMSSATAQALDDGETGPGWTCFGGPGSNQTSLVGAWAPGMPAIKYPNQTGITMNAGDVLVMQIHYNLANGAPTADTTKVELEFAPVPVMWHAQMFPMPNHDFEIPPRTVGFQSKMSLPALGIPANLWGVAPHMHTKGVEIRVDVTHGDGSKSCLIDIPKWNFQWQQLYFFSAHAGIPLKPDDALNISCTWDNNTDGMVTWGENTADEMCLSFLYLTGSLQ